MKDLFNRKIQQAIEIAKNGGIIIFPTDTAFGIGCRIDREEAVDRLFKLKKRPRSKAVPVLVSSKKMAISYYAPISTIVRHLMKKYWPGALTIVASCREEKIYSPIRGGGNTVGLRLPDHAVIIEIIKGVGVPILGPSANFHGKPTPYRQEDLDKELIKKVDMIVPGKCKAGMVSTVIDTSVSPPKIIRQGAVTLNLPHFEAKLAFFHLGGGKVEL